MIPGGNPTNNRNALTGMLCGLGGWLFYILGFCLDAVVGAATAGLGAICLFPLDFVPPLLWLLAVIYGHLALSQIRHTGAGGRGQAVTGLVSGYLGLGILVLFVIAIIFILVTGFGAAWLTKIVPYFPQKNY
jgi:hypothetical protein